MTIGDVETYVKLEGILVPLGIGAFQDIRDAIHTPSKEAEALLKESDASALEMIRIAQEERNGR